MLLENQDFIKQKEGRLYKLIQNNILSLDTIMGIIATEAIKGGSTEHHFDESKNPTSNLNPYSNSTTSNPPLLDYSLELIVHGFFASILFRLTNRAVHPPPGCRPSADDARSRTPRWPGTSPT